MLFSKNIARCFLIAFALSVAFTGAALAGDTQDKGSKKPGNTICNPADGAKPDAKTDGKKKPASGC